MRTNRCGAFTLSGVAAGIIVAVLWLAIEKLGAVGPVFGDSLQAFLLITWPAALLRIADPEDSNVTLTALSIVGNAILYGLIAVVICRFGWKSPLAWAVLVPIGIAVGWIAFAS